MLLKDIRENTIVDSEDIEIDDLILMAQKKEIDLRCVDFSGVDIQRRKFSDIDMQAADFDFCIGVNAEFNNCNLREASFNHCRFNSSTFYGCVLRGAALINSNFGYSVFNKCDFTDSYFDGSDLHRVCFTDCSIPIESIYEARASSARYENVSISYYLPFHGIRVETKLVGSRPICSVDGFGSDQRKTVLFLTNNGPIVKSGCFVGTLEEFVNAVNTRRRFYTSLKNEYLAVANLFEIHAKEFTPVK